MKNSLKFIILLIVAVIILGGCSKSEMNDAVIEGQKITIAELNSEIKELQGTKEKLDAIVIDKKIDKDVAEYVVTINIKQSHFTLDFEVNMKDELNDINIEIPVSKEFYDSVEDGTVLNDDFRAGSFIMNGSVGSWDVTVAGKEIR